jgi:hypothetical protein
MCSARASLYSCLLYHCQGQQHSNGGDNRNAAFKLKPVSNEFLFRALYILILKRSLPMMNVQFNLHQRSLCVYGTDIDGKLVRL